MSINPLSHEDKMKWLIQESKAIQAGSKNPTPDLTKKVETFFQKATHLYLDLRDSNKKYPNELVEEFSKLRTICKNLGIIENNPIKLFYEKVAVQSIDVPALDRNVQNVAQEFLTGKEILQIQTLSPETEEFGIDGFIRRINEGISLKNLGFSEESLKEFLKKHGSKISRLNLKDFTITDVTLLDECRNLKELSLENCEFQGVDLHCILQDLNAKKLQKFNLSRVEISDDIAYEITRFAHLQSLNLSSTTLSSRGLAAISESIKGLQELDVSENKIGDQGALSLLNFKNLKSLKANKCEITSVGMGSIGKMASLEELDVSLNKIGDAGASPLLNFKNLKSLKANKCEITSVGMGSIGKMASLEELDISCNWIEDEGALALAKLNNLKKLNASFCQIRSVGMGYIGQMTSLEELDVYRNWIEDKGALAFLNLKKLKSLKARSCQITAVGMASVGQITTLEELDISRNNIGDQGALALSSLNLKRLNAFDCQITGAGIGSIVQITSLEELDISFNEIGDEGALAFLNLKNLKKVDARFCLITSVGEADLRNNQPDCMILI